MSIPIPRTFPAQGRDYRSYYDASRSLRCPVGQADGISTMSGFAFPVDDTLVASPFILGASVYVRDIAVVITGVIAAKKIRLGIYKNSGRLTLYPGRLILDFGEISTAALGEFATPAQVPALKLDGDSLYWIVCNTNDPNPSYACWTGDQALNPIPGADISAPRKNTISKVLAYGALPAAFPAGGTDGISDDAPGYGLTFV